MKPSPLTCWCPLTYWRLLCERHYPSVLEYRHSYILNQSEQILFEGTGEDDGDWVRLTLTVLVQHGEQALVECHPAAIPDAQARVGTITLAAPKTTLRWLDPMLPLPYPWLPLLEAASLAPPPGYRQGSRWQRQVRSRPITQAVLQFIQAQELALLYSLDHGESVSEDQIGVSFSPIAEFLGFDASATLALLVHLETHNLLMSQLESNTGTHLAGFEVPSDLAYLSIPFYQAITPELLTHHTALEQNRAGRLKRQQGIRQLQQALQSYTRIWR